MSGRNRPPGFWAEIGVVYEAEHFGPLKYWRAQVPGHTDIVGHGRTKPQALAELKSARARAPPDPGCGG